MPRPEDSLIPIGDLARRSGVAASALRFYETQGLLQSQRNAAGRRLFVRSTLRRVAFIRAAQNLGLPLEQIRDALAGLPGERTPTQADWQRLSRAWQGLLDQRIAALTQLRDQLGSCIGCGCLSLSRCALYNPQDQAARAGAGPRYWLGDTPAPLRPLEDSPRSSAAPRAKPAQRRPRSP